MFNEALYCYFLNKVLLCTTWHSVIRLFCLKGTAQSLSPGSSPEENNLKVFLLCKAQPRPALNLGSEYLY